MNSVIVPPLAATGPGLDALISTAIAAVESQPAPRLGPRKRGRLQSSGVVSMALDGLGAGDAEAMKLSPTNGRKRGSFTAARGARGSFSELKEQLISGSGAMAASRKPRRSFDKGSMGIGLLGRGRGASGTEGDQMHNATLDEVISRRASVRQTERRMSALQPPPGGVGGGGDVLTMKARTPHVAIKNKDGPRDITPARRPPGAAAPSGRGRLRSVRYSFGDMGDVRKAATQALEQFLAPTAVAALKSIQGDNGHNEASRRSSILRSKRGSMHRLASGLIGVELDSDGKAFELLEADAAAPSQATAFARVQDAFTARQIAERVLAEAQTRERTKQERSEEDQAASIAEAGRSQGMGVVAASAKLGVRAARARRASVVRTAKALDIGGGGVAAASGGGQAEEELNAMLLEGVSLARTMLNADLVTIFVHAKGREELWSRWGTSLDCAAKPIRIKQTLGIAGSCFNSLKPIRIADAYESDLFNPTIDKETGYHTRSVLAVPLTSTTGKALGVMQCINKLGAAESQQPRRQSYLDGSGANEDDGGSVEYKVRNTGKLRSIHVSTFTQRDLELACGFSEAVANTLDRARVAKLQLDRDMSDVNVHDGNFVSGALDLLDFFKDKELERAPTIVKPAEASAEGLLPEEAQRRYARDQARKLRDLAAPVDRAAAARASAAEALQRANERRKSLFMFNRSSRHQMRQMARSDSAKRMMEAIDVAPELPEDNESSDDDSQDGDEEATADDATSRGGLTLVDGERARDGSSLGDDSDVSDLESILGDDRRSLRSGASRRSLDGLEEVPTATPSPTPLADVGDIFRQGGRLDGAAGRMGRRLSLFGTVTLAVKLRRMSALCQETRRGLDLERAEAEAAERRIAKREAEEARQLRLRADTLLAERQTRLDAEAALIARAEEADREAAELEAMVARRAMQKAEELKRLPRPPMAGGNQARRASTVLQATFRGAKVRGTIIHWFDYFGLNFNPVAEVVTPHRPTFPQKHAVSEPRQFMEGLVEPQEWLARSVFRRAKMALKKRAIATGAVNTEPMWAPTAKDTQLAIAGGATADFDVKRLALQVAMLQLSAPGHGKGEAELVAAVAREAREAEAEAFARAAVHDASTSQTTARRPMGAAVRLANHYGIPLGGAGGLDGWDAYADGDSSIGSSLSPRGTKGPPTDAWRTTTGGTTSIMRDLLQRIASTDGGTPGGRRRQAAPGPAPGSLELRTTEGLPRLLPCSPPPPQLHLEDVGFLPRRTLDLDSPVSGRAGTATDAAPWGAVDDPAGPFPSRSASAPLDPSTTAPCRRQTFEEMSLSSGLGSRYRPHDTVAAAAAAVAVGPRHTWHMEAESRSLGPTPVVESEYSASRMFVSKCYGGGDAGGVRLPASTVTLPAASPLKARWAGDEPVPRLSALQAKSEDASSIFGAGSTVTDAQSLAESLRGRRVASAGKAQGRGVTFRNWAARAARRTVPVQ